MRDGAGRLRELATAELSEADRGGLRALFAAAWPAGDFDEDDWAHAMGGRHWLVEVGRRIVSHASVVERTLLAGDRPLRTGYVEAVATLPAYERRGYGSRVVAAATEHIRERFELGALGTGAHAFYERSGWQVWAGPTSVMTPAGPVRTPDEDGYVMVLRTPRTPPLDPTGDLVCDWRPGDAW